MICEHFIYGIFNNVGTRLVKSGNVEILISKETLNYLCHVGGDVSEPKRVDTLISHENVVARTYLRPAKDEYGRKGVWNHTILIQIPKLENHFIHELDKPPHTLQPLKVET